MGRRLNKRTYYLVSQSEWKISPYILMPHITPFSFIHKITGIIELIVFLGGMVAQLTSGLWIEKLGFITPYWIIFGCHMAAVLYAIFFVPESRAKSSENPGRLFSLQNLKSSWKVYGKATGSKKRNLVVLTFCNGVLAIAVMGINGVVNLYTLHSPLCFSPTLVGYFLAFRQFMHGVGGVTAIKVLGMCLPDAVVSRIAILSYTGFLIFLGFSANEFMVFMGEYRFKSFQLLLKRKKRDPSCVSKII